MKSLIYSYKPDSEKRDGIRSLFGDNVFSYSSCNRFGTIGYSGNVSAFVAQSFNGHMSSGKEVMPVLNAFIGGCNQNQNKIIQKTYTHLENIHKESPLDELKQMSNNLLGVIISWKEKIQEYSNLKILLPYEDATCILNRIDSILQDMEDYKSFCRILTALGYFALCFLSLTENAYVNQLNAKEEGQKRKFEAVKSALPKLLKAIIVFLDDSEVLSQQADESHDSLHSNERRIQQETQINDVDIVDSGDFDDLILKLTRLSQASYDFKTKRAERARMISDFVNAHFASEQISNDEIVEEFAQKLGIDSSDKYTPIRMMLKKCSVALKLTTDLRIDYEGVQDCDYIYREYLSRAKMLRQTIGNDYEPEK